MTDEFARRAREEGYRARSAYKLAQIDETVDLFAPGDRVLDLGAAPGGWLQVAAEAVGPEGTVVGVDRRRIDAVDAQARVETVQGDLTDAETTATVRSVLGEADVVVSDAAPDLTGEYDLDQARSVHLARTALGVATDLLAGGGHFVVKVFEGRDFEEFREGVESEFRSVRSVHPEASRDASSEVYVVGTGRLTAPVRPGDRVHVTVADVGDEGDGIARVEGFTLFVPGTDEGDQLTVEVTDVKERFGFAEPVEE
jgi:23S rRNA (uridine2552-2'-O)-methyltransferase